MPCPRGCASAGSGSSASLSPLANQERLALGAVGIGQPDAITAEASAAWRAGDYHNVNRLLAVGPHEVSPFDATQGPGIAGMGAQHVLGAVVVAGLGVA
jgi:hypothetical protein